LLPFFVALRAPLCGVCHRVSLVKSCVFADILSTSVRKDVSFAAEIVPGYVTCR
jgi:hypothetical protein